MLYAVCCMLYAVCCVLCTAYCVRCAVCCVLCTRTARCALCASVFCVLYQHSTNTRQPSLLYRYSGYVFFGCAALMMWGLAIIDARKLSFYHFDFPSLAQHESTTEVGLEWVNHELWMRAVGVWFTITGLWSLRMAMKRRFQAHRAFIIRNIAAGLWVRLRLKPYTRVSVSSIILVSVYHGSDSYVYLLNPVGPRTRWRGRRASRK